MIKAMMILTFIIISEVEDDDVLNDWSVHLKLLLCDLQFTSIFCQHTYTCNHVHIYTSWFYRVRVQSFNSCWKSYISYIHKFAYHCTLQSSFSITFNLYAKHSLSVSEIDISDLDQYCCFHLYLSSQQPACELKSHRAFSTLVHVILYYGLRLHYFYQI